MEQQLPAASGKERKKNLKLDEQQWEQVRTLVFDFFRQSEKAAKVTYEVLFREIEQKYPQINLNGCESAFKKHVASLDKLRENAGIKLHHEVLSKEYCKKLNDIFHEILIGLSEKEFESIKFEGIIQRAHTLDPNLCIIDKNRKTLAKHFPIKQLKTSALGKRPAEAAVSPGDSNRAAEAAQALAAAAIDVPRRGEIQGRRDVQDGRFRPPKRRRIKDVFSMPSSDSEPRSPRVAEPSTPAAQDAAIVRDIHATGTQLAACDGPNGVPKCLSMLCEYSSSNDQQENLSSNAQKKNPSSNAHTADRGQAATADNDGTCISCLIFGTFRY